MEALLAEDAEVEDFLESPALEAMAQMFGEDQGGSLTGRQLGSYHILSLLGMGGMGEVYRARDLKLKREVAVKVLPEEFSHDAERVARFQREAEVLASLSHPHIGAIYDLAEFGELRYLVLELVEGETLAERIARGPVPIVEALAIAKQITEALDAAHEKGIIHRDLKPANVKIRPDGRVKVLDFGLAKIREDRGVSQESSNSSSCSVQTQHGVILGTMAYMSPEQARGKTVDKRADTWAFGCILYELLTSCSPFQGQTLPDTIAAVLDREPDWQALPPSTPAKIRNLLRRLLQKDPHRRLRDLGVAGIEITEALAAAQLRPWRRKFAGPGILALALVALLAAAVFVYRFTTRGEVIDSVAILPFVNAGANPDTEYLSDGITESLINNLSQLPNLKVKSRDSVFRYKGRDPDAQAVGRALGVRAVLKARVTQRGDNLTISTELIDARDNSHVWGQQYNRKLADIFALQEEIAREITNTMRLHLTGADEKRLAKTYTVNTEAYQDYLKGRYWWNKRNKEGFNKGIQYFQQAIERDTAYALAYAGLADSYTGLADYGFVPPKQAFPKAQEAVVKALQIDDTLAEAHASLALIKTAYYWDWAGAEKESQRAIQLNPGYASSHYWYGMILMNLGRIKEAVAEIKRSLEIDPLSLIANRTLGEALLVGRQYDKAIEQERKTLELDPSFILAHTYLGMTYLQEALYDEAIAEFERELMISPGYTEAVSWLAYAHAVTGRKAEAQKTIDQLTALSKQTYVPAPRIARIYAGLGEKNKAIEWLENGYAEHSTGGAFTNVALDPAYDSLHSDPRFADLLRRMHLQP